MVLSRRVNDRPLTHLYLRHVAVECVEEQREDQLVEILLRTLLQDDWQLLQQRHRGLDALGIVEHRPDFAIGTLLANVFVCSLIRAYT